MKRNSLYLIIGALIVAVAVIGYLLYQEQREPSLEIEVDGNGLSVDTN
jgi:hypothetical protein